MADTEYRHVQAYEGYDLWAPTYDYWKHPVKEMATRHAVRILSPEPGEQILDAGCGTGSDLALIQAAGATAVGIDFSEAMLGLAVRAAPGAELRLADLQEPLPFADASFDAVLCNLVADHLESLGRTLRELFRVLRPAGRLVMAVAHPDFEGVPTVFRSGGQSHYIPTYGRGVQDYLDCLGDTDFEDIAFRAFKGDATLVEKMPAARVHLGKPVLFLAAATVAPSLSYVESPAE